MNAKERFNSIINSIEKYCETEDFYSPGDIADKISSEVGFSFREMNSVFSFLIGNTFLEYIRERKMMAAYKMLISCPILDIEAAVCVSGYDNQSSFTKKFNKQFGTTPKKAFYEKDESKILPIKTWEHISSAEELFESVDVSAQTNTVKFGISKEQYDKILEASDYQALYSFNDSQSEAAFKISEDYGVSLKNAFEFVDEYTILFCDEEDSQLEANEKDIDLFTKNLPELVYLYFGVFEGKKSLCETLEFVNEARMNGLKADELHPSLWIRYSENDKYDLKDFLVLALKFEELNGDDFDDFIVKIGLGYSPEEAAAPDEWPDVTEDYESNERFLAFSEWTDKETDYVHMERFDEAYDEENPCYSDEDNEYEGFILSEDYE